MNFPDRIGFDSVGLVHSWWGWVTVGILAVVGLWGLGLALTRRRPGTAFGVGVGVGVTALLIQTGLGLWSFGVDGVDPGNQHVFYGVVVLFTLAFAYIYRAQLAKRPALAYGLLLLFLMGLGMRGIMTFGENFGAAAEAITQTNG